MDLGIERDDKVEQQQHDRGGYDEEDAPVVGSGANHFALRIRGQALEI